MDSQGTRKAVRCAAVAVAVLALAAGEATAKNDQIIFIDGRVESGVQIMKETVDEVRGRGSVGTVKAREVLRIVHGSPPASYAKGESSLVSGRYSAAAEAFVAAQAEGGAEWVKPYALYNQAEALRRGGIATEDVSRLGEAVDTYRRFLSEHADHFLFPAAKWGLGDALLNQDDVSGARAQFEEVAQRKYGDYWELWGKLGIGLCAVRQESYTEALTELETTISNAKRPGFGEIMARAQVAKGQTYMAKKDYDQAIRYYEGLAASGEGQGAQAAGAAYVSLARAYKGRNKGDDKRRALKTYMAVSIYYAGAPEAYAEALYESGKLFEELGEGARAQSFFRELKARCPESSWARKAP